MINHMKINPELDLNKLKNNIGSGIHRLRFNGVSVPVKYRRGSNDIMIILFHGALNQHIRPYPYFPSFLPDLKNCHQISIADSTLEINEAIKSGWYIGGADMPLQQQLPHLLNKLFDLAGTTKRIYIGGSSGGFAALYNSLLDPGSICIAVNPQTDLNLYNLRSTGNYLKYAWPKINSISEVDHNIVCDLPKAYSKGYGNMIIYLQSIGDYLHYLNQLPRFFESAIKSKKLFLLNTGYWGVPGHSNSIPSRFYYPWVKAVVDSPWFDSQAILDTHHMLTSKHAFEDHKAAASHKAVDQQYLHLADRLRDFHFRQPLEI